MFSATETNVEIFFSGYMAACNSHLWTSTYCKLLPHACVGGFQTGDSSMNPGDSVVARSIVLGEPVVYVSANYRVSGTISPCLMMIDCLCCRPSSFWILGREGDTSCEDWKHRSQRSYACHSHRNYHTILTSQRAFRFGMGSQICCCLRR